MPKPDGNKDYYGILELKQDASVDEIKKAYHKLAFKWHPDRNHGREQEAATKFQDVSSAYEILIEPTLKAKYDIERAKVLRKNTTIPITSPNNPYNPYNNFPSARPPPPPPPSSRADTNTNAGGGAQYAQYTTQTNAPWSSAYANIRRAQAQEAHKAWESMKNGGGGGGGGGGAAGGTASGSATSGATSSAGRGFPPSYVPPTSRNQSNVPLPPRRPMPAAFNPQSRPGGPSAKVRAGWSESEDQRKDYASGQARPAGPGPGPGLSRANTMRSPRRAGFHPGASLGDEPPARNSSAYYNVRADGTRGGRPQSFVHPTAPKSAEYPPRPEQPRVFRNVSSEENFGDRLSTPYATGGGERTYFSSADLFRNPRPDSATNMSSDWDRDDRSPREKSRHRHRSASPRMNARDYDSESSSDASSEDDEPPDSRSKLRPKSFRNRQPRHMPPPPPPPPPTSKPSTPQNAERAAQPGLTVENEFGKVQEFSKPIKRSTWNSEIASGQTQTQRVVEETNNLRRTSTGNIPAQRSPQPSPLHTATNATPDVAFEPLEKPLSWQQQYGSPTDPSSQRRFEPPAAECKPSSAANAPDNTANSASPPKPDGSYFEAQSWQEKINNSGPNLFAPQNVSRHGSPAKGKANGNLKVPRKASIPRKQTIPKSAKTGSDGESVPSMSSSTESVSSGNAMDIDADTPPAKDHLTASNENADSTDHLNLKDLGQTAPFTSSNNNGLGNLNDLSTSLPFNSQASTLPPEDVSKQKLWLPYPPKPPALPNISALRAQDWEQYMQAINIYMGEWSSFNTKMLKHFNSRQWATENELPRNWLEGVGEVGLNKYLSWLEEDIRVRQHWEVSIERHMNAMRDFQQVKKLASTCKFVQY